MEESCRKESEEGVRGNTDAYERRRRKEEETEQDVPLYTGRNDPTQVLTHCILLFLVPGHLLHVFSSDLASYSSLPNTLHMLYREAKESVTFSRSDLFPTKKFNPICGMKETQRSLLSSALSCATYLECGYVGWLLLPLL